MAASSAWSVVGVAWVAALAAQTSEVAPTDLGIDPVTLLQWREACRLVAEHEAEIWPGYRLGDLPALMLNPKVAEVLVRYPRPPPDFVRWIGSNPIGDEPLLIRRGTTVFDVGMDTTTAINGVRTLVVTDRGARDGINDAYNLAVQVHEGFHAFADAHLRIPSYSELDLADYPDLDAERSAHLHLEGGALLAALKAESIDEVEEHTIAFLGERARRRVDLPAQIVRAEDANELNEGLATYVEWRALELWLAHGVAPEVVAASKGFRFPDDIAHELDQKTIQLGHLARHTMGVNGGTFGTAVVRRRCYFFGAAQARLLDRLAPEWKAAVVSGRTLHELLLEALGDPAAAELGERADALEKDSAFPLLVMAKRGVAAEATKQRDARIASVLSGPGTLVRFDVSQLWRGPLAPASYTPFGVLRVGPGRRLFGMSPTLFTFGGVSLHTTTGEIEILADDTTHELLLRTPTPAAELLAALAKANATRSATAGATEVATSAVTPLDPAFELEGAAAAAAIASDGSVVIKLTKSPP